MLCRDVRFIVQRWAKTVSDSMTNGGITDEDVIWIIKVLYEDHHSSSSSMDGRMLADVMDIVGTRVIHVGSPNVRCTLDTVWLAMCMKGLDEASSRRMCVRYSSEQGRLLELRPEHLTAQPTEVLVSSFTTLIMCGVRAASFGRLGHEEVYARLLFMYSETVMRFIAEAEARLRRMPERCFSQHRTALESEEVSALLRMLIVYCKATCQLLRRLPWTFGTELLERSVLDTIIAHTFTPAGRDMTDDVSSIIRFLHAALETGYKHPRAKGTQDAMMLSVAALRTFAGSGADVGTRVCFPEDAAKAMDWRQLLASMDLLDDMTAGPANWSDRRRTKTSSRMTRKHSNMLVVNMMCTLRNVAMIVSYSHSKLT